MRVLLDECVPRPLLRELSQHAVRTVPEMGWAGKRNGELLGLIKSAGFDAFITTDQNFEHQQNLQTAAMTSGQTVGQLTSALRPLGSEAGI